MISWIFAIGMTVSLRVLEWAKTILLPARTSGTIANPQKRTHARHECVKDTLERATFASMGVGGQLSILTSLGVADFAWLEAHFYCFIPLKETCDAFYFGNGAAG